MHGPSSLEEWPTGLGGLSPVECTESPQDFPKSGGLPDCLRKEAALLDLLAQVNSSPNIDRVPEAAKFARLTSQTPLAPGLCLAIKAAGRVRAGGAGASGTTDVERNIRAAGVPPSLSHGPRKSFAPPSTEGGNAC